MDTLRDIKARARQDARKRRKAAARDPLDAANSAMKVFYDAVDHSSKDVIALYYAIQSELDPRPLVEALWKKGQMLCFPVVVAADTPLIFRAASPETPFIKGAFGAAIPDESAPEVTPTIVIAPLLAFDRELYRLGYGGGFYDRTLEILRAAQPTRAYGYAYAAQEAEQIPIEPTDQRLDGVITEAGLLL